MAKKIKKIIHLSDLHCGYMNLTSNFENIVTRLIFHKTPCSDYVIVITGDLVDNANKRGIYEKASIQLDRLKHAGFDVLVIPGNHDYGTGIKGDKKFIEKFKLQFYKDASITFPKLDIIKDMAFIGLDSMACELHWYDRFFAEGELGIQQLERLNALLACKQVKKCDYKIVYLHHHPFESLMLHKLKDSESFQKVLEGHKIDVLLFGHNHGGLVWNGAWGIPRVYDSGSSTGKRKQGPHRVIDLSKEPFFDYDARLLI